MGRVIAVCISTKKGTIKHPVPSALLVADHGVEGDVHADGGIRQLSLLARESTEKIRASLPDIPPGAFAENVLTEGLVLCDLPIGARLAIGSAIIEITQIGKDCHAACEIRRLTGDCVMPREGVFARVIRGGRITAGDRIAVI